MAMLSLAGVRFELHATVPVEQLSSAPICWSVYDTDGKRFFDFTDTLPAQINRCWREGLFSGMFSNETGYTPNDAMSLIEDD